MRREHGVIVPEDITNEFSPLLIELDTVTTNVETFLARLGVVDGWKTRPIDLKVFLSDEVQTSRACVELIKEHRGVRVFISPLDGSVIKAAATREKEVLIRKEDHAWLLAQAVFPLDKVPHLIRVEIPDSASSPLLALEMPYYGIPLKYWPTLTGIPIPPEALDSFKVKMVRLVLEQGLVPTDMNRGNILLRMKDGQLELVPIDWENSYTITSKPRSERGSEASFVEGITRVALAPHYPK
ncbi:MAG: hypothetical protein Q7S79_03600 [bacterium]|nr:hypothetical protein [bacterium]